MSVLSGDLKVGIVQFHRGADLMIVQETIDRLYRKYTEAMEKLGDHIPDLSLPAIPADHSDAPGN